MRLLAWQGGALYIATQAYAGTGLPPLAVALANVSFTANLSPNGSFVAIPGTGDIRLTATGVNAAFNSALQNGGILLADNVTSVFTDCAFANNSCAGDGALFSLGGFGGSTTVRRGTITGGSALRGGVAALSQGHSLTLDGCTVIENTAHSGALLLVTSDVASPAAQARLGSLRLLRNQAVVGAHVFMEAFSAAVPKCSGCQLAGNVADAGPQFVSTDPYNYTVHISNSETGTNGLISMSVVLFDQFNQQIQAWPDLTVRAVPAPGYPFVILTGATGNNTYAGGSTNFDLLRISAQINDTAYIAAVVSSPTLPVLTAASAAAPPHSSVFVVQCLTAQPDFEVFDPVRLICVCSAGYVFTRGSPYELSQDPSAGACRPCAPGLYNPSPGATVCVPCPDGKLSVGTDCVECPDGAACVGTNVPLALEGYWHAPSVTSKFFECPEGFCAAESDLDPTVLAAEALLAAPALLADAAGVLTDEALQYLGSAGGHCAANAYGPLCGVCEPNHTVRQHACQPCAPSAMLANWSAGRKAGWLIFASLVVLVVLVFGVRLPRRARRVCACRWPRHSACWSESVSRRCCGLHGFEEWLRTS